MTLAEYIICMGLSHAKEQVFSATHTNTHSICMCECGTFCYQRRIPGRLAMAVCEPACSRLPSATLPDRRTLPVAECYHTFTLVVVSNIYTFSTHGYLAHYRERMCERI